MYGLNSYVPLFCKSNFSFLEGASHPEELVEEAHRLGIGSIALTDRDGLYGVVKAHVAARERGIKLIIGATITVNQVDSMVLLAKNHAGYINLCQIISEGRLQSPKGKSNVAARFVLKHCDGLICMMGHRSACVGKEELSALAKGAVQAFGPDFYLMLQNHREFDDGRRNRSLHRLGLHHEIATVATTEVLYHSRERRPLQDVLTCIKEGVQISGAGRRTRMNAEHYILAPAGFGMLYADFPEAVERSFDIAKKCRFSLDELDYRYPSEVDERGEDSLARLQRLTGEGAVIRYGNRIPDKVTAQVQSELALIGELGYAGYFLTMYEIVRFCRASDILCQGRGSAANSAVCYCLGITAVDPVAMDLLFERFLSKERNEPPDIDLDIEHNRREEVIQYVYKKYGYKRAAMVAVVVRYRPKSAIRDVGKVLGFKEVELSRLAAVLSRYSSVDKEALLEVGFDPQHRGHANLYTLATELVDFPRHMSIHPGGFILGSAPICTLVPIENCTMPGRTVIQWDKYDVETLGLFKVDLLGLGALTHLHLCFDIIKKTQGKSLSLATIPQGDPDTYDMISQGDTIGVFQIESRAQMQMLPRLRPKTFYDLVIEISIVRPGPITGQMVHPYLRRRNKKEAVIYPHSCLEPVLKKTLGVPLFQEQVMKIAMIAADYTPGEADQLRRDMAAWKRSGRIERHREKLIVRMEQKGITTEFAARVFEQIRGFGEYGFPESHAASFALISYASAYLRKHYPAAFTCGLLNALPMGFYTSATLVADAKRNGCKVRTADVLDSDWYCKVTAPGIIKMGLRHIKGVGAGDYQQILRARAKGPHDSLAEFLHHCRVKVNVRKALAKAGAFSCFDVNRRESLWQSLGGAKRDVSGLSIADPASTRSFNDVSALEGVFWDLSGAGHSAAGHPLQHFRTQLIRQNVPAAVALNRMPHRSTVNYVGVVICRQRPSTAAGVVFMTLEDETGFVNLVFWKDVYEQNRVLAKTSPILGVTGELQKQDGVAHLIVKKLWTPNIQLTATPQSRDFK